jgi:cytidylate kinase
VIPPSRAFRERWRGDRWKRQYGAPALGHPSAQDAVVLDSTNMSEDEVVSRIEELVEQRLVASR